MSILNVIVFLLLFLLQFSSSSSAVLSNNDISNISHSLEVAELGHDIEKVCVGALGSDHSKDLNIFSYGCFLKKYNSTQKHTVIEDFKLCCNLMLSKNRHDEELDYPNRFCECIDMINIVHQPFIKECTSAKLPQCEITSSPWGHDDKLREDVGVILVYKQNVMLGGGGIAIFSVLSFISLLGFGYLVFICILYRCCQNKNNDNNGQQQQQQYDNDYYGENGYGYGYADETYGGGGGYELSDASTVAATTTPHSTSQATTQSTSVITQIPLEQQQPSISSSTKTKETTKSISMEKF